MNEAPKFISRDAYCADIQEHIKSELEDLSFELRAHHRGAVKILAKRIAELDKTISLLRQRDLQKVTA